LQGEPRTRPRLEQAVLELVPGTSQQRSTGPCEETLFVLSGAGLLRANDGAHALEPEVGACLEPGIEYELVCAGRDPLRVLAVRIPDPEPPEPGSEFSGILVHRLSAQEAEPATTERWFRVIADPETGLRSATHFVGYIPTVRAPEHFHTYDEVIYVIDGEGLMHVNGESRPLGPGSTIELAARTVHCLENTGEGVMRIVAVFRPAGSPAAAYYPDGTPAYVDVSLQEEVTK